MNELFIKIAAALWGDRWSGYVVKTGILTKQGVARIILGDEPGRNEIRTLAKVGRATLEKIEADIHELEMML